MSYNNFFYTLFACLVYTVCVNGALGPSLHRIERKSIASIGDLAQGKAIAVRGANVEVYNKSNFTINVIVEDSYQRVHPNIIPNDKACQLQIDCSMCIKISVKEGRIPYHYCFTPDLMRKIAKRQHISPDDITFFLTYDNTIGLRPQTGKWRGLRGKTETGFSLKNNVTADDLEEARQAAIQQGMYKQPKTVVGMAD